MHIRRTFQRQHRLSSLAAPESSSSSCVLPSRYPCCCRAVVSAEWMALCTQISGSLARPTHCRYANTGTSTSVRASKTSCDRQSEQAADRQRCCREQGAPNGTARHRRGSAAAGLSEKGTGCSPGSSAAGARRASGSDGHSWEGWASTFYEVCKRVLLVVGAPSGPQGGMLTDVGDRDPDALHWWASILVGK